MGHSWRTEDAGVRTYQPQQAATTAAREQHQLRRLHWARATAARSVPRLSQPLSSIAGDCTPPSTDPRTGGVLNLLSAHVTPLLPYLSQGSSQAPVPAYCRAESQVPVIASDSNVKTRPRWTQTPPRPPLVSHITSPRQLHTPWPVPLPPGTFHRPPQQNRPSAYKQVLTSALLILGLDTCFCVYVGGLPVRCIMFSRIFGPWPPPTTDNQNAPSPSNSAPAASQYVQTEIQTLCHHLQDLSPA